MEVTVFSDQSVHSSFAKIEKAKSFSVTYYPLNDLKKNVNNTPADSVIYADITGVPQPALKKILALLASSNRVFGILDPKGSSDDPALFFHSGASDYIGKTLFKDGADSTRIKKIYEFGKICLPEQKAELKAAPGFSSPLSGTDWEGVVSGKEYTFCFMYIELDNQKEIRKRFTGKSLEEFTKNFHGYVEKLVSDVHGRIWMWTDLGGLILFPFDGSCCPAIFNAFNLMLNRRIFSFEDFDYDMLLSFRIAIHIGETTYHSRGDTGKIVSDSVNFIHHLKQNFAEPGNMYLTEEARVFIPSGFEKFFIKAGTYEEREVYRLRSLI